MGQRLIIFGTYWGTWKNMLGTSFELEEYVGNTLGMWLEQHNPQRKIYILFV
jgi:hypothetical protein